MVPWLSESKTRNAGSLVDADDFVLGTMNCNKDILEFKNSSLGSEKSGR